MKTHLDGVQFLLQHLLDLLVQQGVVEAAIKAAPQDHIRPYNAAGGAQEQRLVNALPQLIFLAFGTARLEGGSVSLSSSEIPETIRDK